jgi:hypothetical protein
VTRLNRAAFSERSEETLAADAEGWARPLILAFTAVQVISFVLVGAVMAFRAGSNSRARETGSSGLVDVLTSQVTARWQLLLSIAALLAAVWLARHAKQALALYLGTFGALHIWWECTSGRQRSWRAPLAGPDACRVLVDCDLRRGVRLVDRRRRLTFERVGRLIVILLAVSLMRQRDFIENPFTPIFGFAGTAFIAFGLAWDIATCGSWTNGDSARDPAAQPHLPLPRICPHHGHCSKLGRDHARSR